MTTPPTRPAHRRRAEPVARASTNKVMGTVLLVVVLVAAVFALRMWMPENSPAPKSARLGPGPTATPTATPSATPSTTVVPRIRVPSMAIPFLPTSVPPPPPPVVKVVDARMAKQGLARVPEEQRQAATFRVAAFNVLGASHTTGKGARKGFGSAQSRLPAAMGLLDAHQVTVAGLQEFQPPQMGQFLATRGAAWSVYPGNGVRSDNVIVWRKDVWELLDQQMTPIPYFGGRLVDMPIVLLRHRETDRQVWVGSYHNPANIGGNHAGWRQTALEKEAALAKELNADGTPVVMTGDFNDRDRFACPFSAASGMVSADGARTESGVCHLPDRMSVDWIFGTDEIEFSDYYADWSSQRRRLSDHPVIVTTVDLAAVEERGECRKVKTRSGPEHYCPGTDT